jgi:hypothetical protein
MTDWLLRQDVMFVEGSWNLRMSRLIFFKIEPKGKRDSYGFIFVYNLGYMNLIGAVIIG